MLSFVRLCLTTGWIIPVYDVRSQQRFAFAEDFLRLVLQEQSDAVGGRFLEYALAPLDKEGNQPFAKQALIFTCLQYKSFKYAVGKGEIARKRAISPFPTVFSTLL